MQRGKYRVATGGFLGERSNEGHLVINFVINNCIIVPQSELMADCSLMAARIRAHALALLSCADGGYIHTYMHTYIYASKLILVWLRLFT